jgi:hypothetical protein
MNRNARLLMLSVLLPAIAICQNTERTVFDPADSTNGYYLVVPPRSGHPKGVLVLLCSYSGPESMLAETKLHNVAFNNDILTVMASLGREVYADEPAVRRIGSIVKDVMKRFSIDSSEFALAGYDVAGDVALRYTEMTYEHPAEFSVHPKAVFGIDCPVDLFGFYRRCERTIKKNYYKGAVNDANIYIDLMTKGAGGTIYDKPENYRRLTPFDTEGGLAGNEQYLRNVAVRLYFDTDIGWQLKAKRNGFDDTNIPDGSEMISRLMLLGNKDAEFMAAKQPGMRSNGTRNTSSYSIVDEVDCIHWIKKELDIFDLSLWVPPYKLAVPDGWSVERVPLPYDFAPDIPFKGVDDLRLTPDWADPKGDGHWTYASLWWLDGDQKLDADVIRKFLIIYLEGLSQWLGGKAAATVTWSVNPILKKIKTGGGDQETYSGTVSLINFATLQPITLNCLIHKKICSATGHTALLAEISPKPAGNAFWDVLHNINKSFDCMNK